MKPILAFAAAAIALTGAPALAQDYASSGRIVVSYADLDLGTRSGLRTLDRRIRSAVETACGPTSSADPAGRNDVVQCRTDLLSLARAQRDTALAQAVATGRIQLASGR